MWGTDPMDRCRGSAIVLSMLLLVILSAVGMYFVSVPAGRGETSGRQHRAAVARNMARAGANAAIARFPMVDPEGSPYIRRIPVGPNVTGRYSVTSRKAAAGFVPGSAGGSGIRGVRSGLRGKRDRSSRWRCACRGEDPIRSRFPGGKVLILKWEESGPH